MTAPLRHRPNIFTGANYDLKPEAIRAVARGLSDGSLVRGACVVCDNPLTHGHHEDYAKPLDIVWLCALHHRWRHAYGHTIDEMLSIRDDAVQT